MTYSESAKGQTITRDRAIEEIRQHNLISELDIFFKEVGDGDFYLATDVLNWLGY